MTAAELLDRKALAAELSEISQRFADEGGRLTAVDAYGAARCFTAAADLRRFARVLDDPSLDADLARGRGLADAADLILRQLDGARRFLRSARAVDAYMTRAEARR